MAFTTGTATDYKDLLNKLRDYIISAPAGANWVVERDTSGGAPDQVEMIFKGDGGATDEIYWGVETYYDAGAVRYNWRIKAFTGFNTLQTFDLQPNPSGDSYIPLRNESMDYWFYVTGRRVCMVVKTATSYQFMYAGFLDTYATPDEYPYPMMIMGSSGTSTTVYNSNSLHYASAIHPASNLAYLRDITGEWLVLQNFGGTTSESVIIGGSGSASIWPMSSSNNAGHSAYQGSTLYSLFANGAQGGTPVGLLLRTENDVGSPAVPLFPNIVYSSAPTTQIFGEMHNVYWSALSPGELEGEDTVTDGVTADVYTVFNNVHRTDPWCGYAVKQE